MDISANRSAVKYSSREILRRMCWIAGGWLFRFTPRTCFSWRRLILRCYGAKVGLHVNIYPSALIYFPWKLEIGDWSSIGEGALIYNLGPITIGSKATISHRAHLCAGTHDYQKSDLPLLKPPIVIGDQVWICANAFVGPGVTVGEGAVVGACAVVTKDIAAWTVVAGNPARTIKKRNIIRPLASAV